MTPATEARLLALATLYGLHDPRITVAPTTGKGSRSWRRGIEVTVREQIPGDYVARSVDSIGATDDEAAEVLCADLARDVRERVAEHRAVAAAQAAHADRLEAALTAALATPEHATLPAPVCPAPTGAP